MLAGRVGQTELDQRLRQFAGSVHIVGCPQPRGHAGKRLPSLVRVAEQVKQPAALYRNTRGLLGRRAGLAGGGQSVAEAKLRGEQFDLLRPEAGNAGEKRQGRGRPSDEA